MNYELSMPIVAFSIFQLRNVRHDDGRILFPRITAVLLAKHSLEVESSYFKSWFTFIRFHQCHENTFHRKYIFRISEAQEGKKTMRGTCRFFPGWEEGLHSQVWKWLEVSVPLIKNSFNPCVASER